jgi:polyhydroxybutyrate depolymerase
MLSNRLGCALANRIAAFGAVAGPRAIDSCTPSRPLPVIAFHGTQDAIVPYHGGGSGGAEPAPASFAFWSQNAACTDQPAQVFQNGDATCVERAACAGAAAVRLCTIEGGGHQWPGGIAVPGLGAQTKDIQASVELVEFFLAHPMP